MDTNTLIGLALIICSLIALLYLTYWCRRTVDVVADKKLRTAREILKELRGER